VCAAAALATVVVALVSCGGTSRRPGLGPRAAAAPPAGGPRIFATACASCHTLTGATTTRVTQGGDLAGFRLSQRLVTSFTRIMPVNPRLSEGQIRAVSAYVVAVQERYAHRRH
jgi:mono/diheme cytochrome c family protein